MKTSKSVYIYTAVYTAALLLVGVLTVQGYVFAPRVPYFYVLIVPLFILQGRLFRANSQDKNMKRLFILNLLSNALLFTVKPIIGLQYFTVFHFIMIVFVLHAIGGAGKLESSFPQLILLI